VVAGHPAHHRARIPVFAAIVMVAVAWFAILFTGSYPCGIFDFVQGVIRRHNRVTAYALLMVTNRYPPFSLTSYWP
jgi:hypothetical protein